MTIEKVLRILFVLGGLAALACLGLAALVYFSQSRLIYFPLLEIITTPRSIDLAYESVSFETEDGQKIAGWFVPAEGSRGTVLFCHGNGGNISHRLDSIRIFNRLGLSTLIFDYRGYGQSTGKPTEAGTYLDAEAAWAYLVRDRNLAPSEIILFGRSLGGAVAAHLAVNHRPNILILESTFTSIKDMADTLCSYRLGRLLLRSLVRFHYPTEEYLRQVRCPVLVIHSRHDDLIPFELGCRLFAAAREPKEFLEITGSHNEGFLVSAQQYQQGLESFISRSTGGHRPGQNSL